MLCIISDTHENVPAMQQAVQLIQERSPELVIHCGDIISPPVLKHFEGLPMQFVYGNNDGEREGLQRMAAQLGFHGITDELELELRGKSLYAYHGTIPAKLEAAIDSQRYEYVFCGHTHTVEDRRVGQTRVINPGALFAARVYTFAALDVESDRLEIVEVPPTAATNA